MAARTTWLAFLLLVVGCAGSAQAAQPVVALTETNRLLSFDAAQPGTLTASVAITGIQAGENMLGIDFRPATGQLYGLGSTGRLYVIHPVTGVAAQVGTGTFAVALNGTAFGFDFNPVVDRIRVVSDADQNFRLNPNDGTAVDGDPGTPGAQQDSNLIYTAGDVNAGDNPSVVGSAYTNDFAGATTTTLFGIDSVNDVLVRQGGVNVPPGSPSPNGGALFTIGAGLGANTDANVGLDVAPLTGTAYASLTVGGISGLYTVNLATGGAVLIGTIGDGTVDVRGLALPATVPTLYVVTNTNELRTVRAVSPATNVGPPLTITGLQAGEQLRGVDIRPATGVLYGIGSTGRLYTINLLTGAATQVGGQFTLTGAAFGVAFDPVADRIRVVSDSEQNLRINPDTGAVVIDPAMSMAGTAVGGVAYLNDFPGAPATELLGIDFNADSLVKLTPSPPATATIGPLNVNTGQFIGFDIFPAGNLGLATLSVGANYQLYVVNTTSGGATLVGGFAGNPQVVGMAIAPVGRFSVASSEVAETAGTATITITRTAGSTGPASVDFAATAGSAGDGSDFTAVSGTLQWAEGETSKTFSVPILDDSSLEGSETVNLVLGNPLQGSSLGTGAATLTITDDESPPPVVVPPGDGDPDPGNPPVTDPAPTLTKVSLTNRVFAARGTPKPPRIPRGTRFRFTLSENSTVRVAIDRIKPGRRVKGRCVKPRPRFRKRPRCKRYIRRGSLSHAGKTGANTLRFSGRLRGKALAPGRYRATLRATDSAGQKSKRSRVRFRIVRR